MTRPLLPDANGSAVRAAVVQRNRLLGSFLITLLRMLPNILSNSDRELPLEGLENSG